MLRIAEQNDFSNIEHYCSLFSTDGVIVNAEADHNPAPD